MQGVIKRRREYLHLMRTCSLEHGYFTVTDIQNGAGVPRSTAQDWINRLLEEGCVILKEGKKGRTPARYAAISAVTSSACRRIFTAIDGDRVEIYHECLSGACAAFCSYHHKMAGGVLQDVRRDGTLLHECADLGRKEIDIGLFPSAAVGIAGVEREGDYIIQHIRCTGGPAYSLTDMMSQAEGVCEVRLKRTGKIVEGDVRTRALTHLLIGIDDTDSSDGGATFALTLVLLQHLGRMKGVFPIGHHVAMLNPSIPEKTAGNSCSYINMAIEPGLFEKVRDRALLFISDESLSPDWGMAVRKGFRIPAGLRRYGILSRTTHLDEDCARSVAADHEVALFGRRGVIGALAAVALSGLPNEVLLNPEMNDGIMQD